MSGQFFLGMGIGFLLYHTIKGILWSVGNRGTTYDLSCRISRIMGKYTFDDEDLLDLDAAKVLIARYPAPVGEVER